ncbi:response regulator transcription factor [Paenibacillus crassostreae]|uniref:Two-component system response regulator n=1 Tax=Paenibacillus crassostreae TaxID=1763538 RepID=A0A162KMZ3_9BACL|nr:response regulator [Paenibacillus crassostreae]AOZ92368.1 hypothetical protein LPB68_09085 [Paenibacillus crassostreae]OAB71083.1 hypothetical protein PNBC_21235 [Paenibacillus crassostreae]
MIRVIIVDDDKLVRKGLISAMPWQNFGMSVVGEASNGEKALEFLDEHEVDLMLTDLSMPVMSGIELMRIVRKRYPHVHVVVLTLHQDFEYIQEAMRLGAIDYIAKVQLEKEKFEEVLGRIHNRILEHEQLRIGGLSRQDNHEDRFIVNQTYVLLSINRVSSGNPTSTWIPRYNEGVVELGHNLFLFTPSNSVEGERWLETLVKEIESRSEWAIIDLNGILDLSTQEVYGWIQEYKENDFFYDYNPTRRIIGKSIRTVDHAREDLIEDTMNLFKVNWYALEWVYQDAVYYKILEELKTYHLPQAKLIGFLYAFLDHWNNQFVKISPISVQLQDSLDSWQQVEVWFTQMRHQIRHALNKTGFSPEVIKCIMNAVVFIHEEFDHQLTATDIAKRVNMSRSYFSQCFKEIVGKSFNQYLRETRIEKAKHYLQYSNKTILWIAGNVGYEDDKYFSRSFREHTGMLPSEYRIKVQEGRVVSGK